MNIPRAENPNRCLVSTEELLVYLENRSDDQLNARVEANPHCLAEVERLAGLGHRMTHLLYRIDCPSSQELTEYHLGKLSKPSVTLITQHLASCPHCTEEIAQFEHYLAEMAQEFFPATTPLWQRAGGRVRELYATLISGLSTGTAAPVFALLGDGAAEQGPLIYQAEEIQVSIQIEEDETLPEQQALIGLIVGIEPVGLHVQLIPVGQADGIASTPVDEIGNFSLQGLKPGSYDLVLAQTETKVHIQNLQL